MCPHLISRQINSQDVDVISVITLLLAIPFGLIMQISVLLLGKKSKNLLALFRNFCDRSSVNNSRLLETM